MTYTIETVGLTKSYRSQPVLTGLDLTVRAGTVFALLGPNGAGKTTTVRILATLLRADGGTATIDGLDVATQPDRVRRVIGLTGQYASVDEVLTGRENLRMMTRLRHLGRAQGQRRTAELLERFDLEEAADRRVAGYSGGMRRRLDIAVGLVDDPTVVMLDEPTTGLDPRSRRDVWAAVAGLRDAGVTVLLTTQYLEEADRLADHIAVIDGGRVVAEGTADELKSQVGGEAVELHLPDDAAVDATLDGLRGRPARVDRDALRVYVPTSGAAEELRGLLDLMHARGVIVERVTLHRPTLDDVFLGLTGRSSQPGHPEGAAA